MASDNLVKLKPSEIKELIKQRWRNRTIKTRPICIVGHKGIGKSDIVRQAAQELAEESGKNVRCQTLNLQFCEPPDFLGLPIVRDHEIYGDQTRHARPQLLPGEEDGGGIWFLDEANRCNRDNRAGMLTLIQDRRVNEHAMGKDWIIVMAMNPSDGEDGVAYETQEFDAALEDRISKVYFNSSYEEFLQYMINKHGDDNEVVQWIMNQSDIVDFFGKTRTSPRGLDYMADAIKAHGGLESPGIFNVYAAEVGMEAAHAFRKFLMDSDTIKAEDILQKFDSGLKKRLQTAEKQGRNDILNTLIKAVCVTACQKAKNDELTGKEMDNLTKYVEFIPKDSKAAFFLELGEQTTEDSNVFEKIVDHLIANSKSVSSFLEEHDEKKRGKAV